MNVPARILIVDDDETVLKTFATALSLGWSLGGVAFRR